ncbi:MAG: T9SS type A sorting domain-containing protein [Draconibacterium sp.]|nr:T9SS type A sorting domain-containing protein [Draconibacterium sp.]
MCDFNLVTGKNRLNISDYKNGIYLLKLVSDNKTIVKKFIKN